MGSLYLPAGCTDRDCYPEGDLRDEEDDDPFEWMTADDWSLFESDPGVRS